MSIEREFILYEQALALKELGFDEPCITYFGNISKALFGLKGKIEFHTNTLLDINHSKNVVSSAPTFSQAFRWFREKYNLHPSFTRYKSSSINREPAIFTHLYEIQIIDENADKIFHVGDFNSLEEAELECLKKLISIVKNK